MHGTASTAVQQEAGAEACPPAPSLSFYELHPESFERAVARRQLHEELLDGLDVCNYALGSAEEDLETEGSRLLRQELHVLLDRVDKRLVPA